MRLSPRTMGTALLAAAFVLALPALAPAAPAPNPSANLDQARNGTSDAPVSPVNFQNGNANTQNSHYLEGMSIPYRVRVDGLTQGTHTLTIGWDIRQGGKNALDYITGPNRLEPHSVFLPAHPVEIVDPLESLRGTFSGPARFAIPIPVPAIGGQPAASALALPAPDRDMWIYNGTITAIDYVANADGNLGDLTAAQSESRMRITFNATSASVLFAFGGHIASQTDWGAGNSASAISGSPYHCRLISVDNVQIGNQDRSLKTDNLLGCNVNGPPEGCRKTRHFFNESTNKPGAGYAWGLSANSSGAAFASSSSGDSVGVDVGDAVDFDEGFNLEITITSGRNQAHCKVPFTVHPPPKPTIAGDDIVCPGAVRVYTGPADMPYYNWTVSGGTIIGAANGPTVTVQAAQTCNGTMTLTLDVRSKPGCAGVGSRNVLIKDTVAPVIAGVGGAGTAECPAGPQFSQPTASDDCGGPVQLTYSDARAAGTCPNQYSIIRTWTATDACGNSSTASQTMTITDHTAPVIAALPAAATIECPATPVFATASATDACDSNPRLQYNDVTTPGACPNQFSVTRTWTATDACGNSSTASQTINVVDHTAPVITCPADIAIGSCQNPVSFTVSANDACSGAVTVVATPPSGSTFPVGDNIVTVVATDACGNQAQKTFHVRVQGPPTGDIAGPAAACQGGSATLTGPAGYNYLWSTGATTQSIVVNAAGTYTLQVSDPVTGCSTTLSHPFALNPLPPATIDGAGDLCTGAPNQLCAPLGNYGYLWTLPGGATATTQCVDGSQSGTYTLVVTDKATGCASAPTSKSVNAHACNVNCPHTIGWWMAQCGDGGSGSIKYTPSQLAQIFSCVDDKVAIFSWSNDVAAFCATINPVTVDQRSQAKRQFAGFLANVCTSQLGIVANNGDAIIISLGTVVSFPGFTAHTIGGLVTEADQKLVALESQSLKKTDVQNQYTQIINAFDALNNNQIPGSTCPGSISLVAGAQPSSATTNPGAAGVEGRELQNPIGLAAAAPNPFTGRTRITYVVGADGQGVDLAIFDLAGRRVRQLASGARSAGRYQVDWDGRSDAGQSLPGGVYYVRARVGGSLRVIPLIYMR